jgi:hypothetical protein
MKVVLALTAALMSLGLSACADYGPPPPPLYVPPPPERPTPPAYYTPAPAQPD